MKKLTIKDVIAIVVAVVLIATLTIALSLSMCHYEEPDDLPQQDEVKSPYGNYDYSKKPYFSLGQEYGVLIYKGNGYFMNSGGEFQSFSLLDLSKNMKEYVRVNKQEPIQQQAIYVCPVSEHNHGAGASSLYAGCRHWLILLDGSCWMHTRATVHFPSFIMQTLPIKRQAAV